MKQGRRETIACCLDFLCKTPKLDIPQEVIELVAGMAEDLSIVAGTYDNGDDDTPIATPGFPPSTTGIICFRLQCTAANTAYPLPSIPVPAGMQVLLKGWPANAGTIYIGGSLTEVVNVNQAWPLLPNEQVGYRVRDVSQLFASATAAGDWVNITVEQWR